MKTVLCFGSENLKEDRVGFELADSIDIDGYKFIKCNSPEQIIDYKNVIIVDVVKGINQVKEIKTEQLKNNNIVSLHDFDLGFFLSLTKEMNYKIRIIGVPFGKSAKQVADDVETVLKRL
jgi:Ni,Fe-hydrogenase maturation factor